MPNRGRMSPPGTVSHERNAIASASQRLKLGVVLSATSLEVRLRAA
jgi:hypothetical protein